MSELPPEQVSSYLDYLPAIYQDENTSPFLGRFLLAFERVLHGLTQDTNYPLGLGQELDRMHDYFDPACTREDFLPWLANWVALSLRDDWSSAEQRRFIAKVVPLYRKRGTLDGLKQMLLIYLNAPMYVGNNALKEDDIVEIRTWDYPMQIGKTASLGEDTIIGEPLPHYFEVRLIITDPTYVDMNRKTAIARAIIEQEKPAHTSYDLIVVTPTMQLERFSTIGFDTLIADID